MNGSPRILVAAAIETELAPLRPRLAGLPVHVTRTGIGGEHAAARVRAAVRELGITRVLFLGFAGGLDPALTPGEVIRVGRVRDERGGEIGLADAGSTIVSVDRVVSTAAEKRRLFAASGAAAVDMETFAVARAMRPLGVELIGLRAITDPADTALPAASQAWVTPDGRPRLLPPALWAAAGPWRIGSLLRLGRAARLASGRLADEAERIIRERLA